MTFTTGDISDRVLGQINEVILGLPYHKSCGLELLEQHPGHAISAFQTNDYTLNTARLLHGGVLYGMLDVSCVFAVYPLLNQNQRVVSHDTHYSILLPTGACDRIEMRSHVERIGKRIAFCRTEAWAIDGDDEKKIGLGTVTKSILTM